MREKYIEERHPFWYVTDHFDVLGRGVKFVDIGEGETVAIHEEDAVKVVEKHQATHQRMLDLAAAFAKAAPVASQEFWYPGG